MTWLNDWTIIVTFSKILGLLEKQIKIKMFMFSNSFVFWEQILRSENQILRKYHFKFAEN